MPSADHRPLTTCRTGGATGARHRATLAGLLCALAAASSAHAAHAAQSADTVAHVLDVLVHPQVGVRQVLLHADTDRIATGIEIRVPGQSAVLQRFPVQAGEPAPGGGLPKLLVEDLDGDGHADLMVLSWSGATGNAGYLAWRYVPRTDRFEAIPDFEQLSQPRVEPGTRCLRTRSNGGHLGAIHVLERWCWRDGRLEQVWSQQQTPATDRTDGSYLRVVRERRAGAMVEVERRVMTPEALEREADAQEARRRKPAPAR